jgi:hypothetical protein
MTRSPSLTAVWLTTSLALVLVFSQATPGAAQVPHKMNYQVMLTDDLDQPLAGQSVEMVFTIYDDESAGSALWTETQNATTNSIGVVSVVLGAVNPMDIAFDAPLWLEVQVGGEALSPRRELVSSPYALGVEATGSGDGHSLDADDGDPVDVVSVDSEGRVTIDATLTGDNAVQLPVDAISDAEILDEPSVASLQHAAAETLLHSVVTNLASESIYAPADGYVLAVGTAAVRAEHDSIPNVFAVTCSFTVSSSSIFFVGAQSYTITMDDDLPAGDYSHIVTVHGLFPVTGPGTHAFYFLASAWYERWVVMNRQLSLVYFPTAGGNVDTDTGRPAGQEVDPSTGSSSPSAR